MLDVPSMEGLGHSARNNSVAPVRNLSCCAVELAASELASTCPTSQLDAESRETCDLVLGVTLMAWTLPAGPLSQPRAYRLHARHSHARIDRALVASDLVNEARRCAGREDGQPSATAEQLACDQW